MADILLTLAPRAQLFSADVFGPQGTCDVKVIIRAIRWAMDVWDCKIINLSLGVTEQRLQQVQKRQELLRAIEEAYYRDVLVIAAAHNDHPLTRSYPVGVRPAAVIGGQGAVRRPTRISPINCASRSSFKRTPAATLARSRPSRRQAGPPLTSPESPPGSCRFGPG